MRFSHTLNPSTLLCRRATAWDPRTAHALLLTSGLLHPHHFSGLPLLSINSLLQSLSRGPHPAPRLSLVYLKLMLSPSSPFPSPDHLTFPFVLSSCALLPCIFTGMQVHGLLLKNGLYPCDHYVQTGLLKLYSRDPKETHKLFDEMPKSNLVHYDVLMNSYINAGLPFKALRVFKNIVSQIEPDKFVLSTALKACADSGSLDQGLWIHQYIERKDEEYLKDKFIGSGLVNMYSKCGSIHDAIKVFEKMPERNAYMWSAMISSLATHGFAKEAIDCLKHMQERDDLKPDGIVLLGVLTACSHSGLVEEGLEIFNKLEVKFKIKPQHEHYACAVDILCRVGRLEEAFGVIRKMPMIPLVSVWGALINGCRMHKNAELAERAMIEMKRFMCGAQQGRVDDEGVYVQLYTIYLEAGRKEDARKIRKYFGGGSVKKMRAVSEINVEGVTNLFVSGDRSHPLFFEILGILDILKYQMGREENIEEELLLD